MTGKGDEPTTPDGLQYPMVELFTGSTMLPLMFVNAAATEVLEVSRPPTVWPLNLPGVKIQRTSPHCLF
jgi:hypothetical protein